MNLQMINYTIKDEKLFVGDRINSIKNICQKSNKYRFPNPFSKCELSLNFKSPALLQIIQYKVEEADHIEIQFLYHKECLDNKYFILQEKEKKECSGKIKQIKLESQLLVDAINFNIFNTVNDRASIIYYIILKGIKNQEAPKKKGVNNVSNKDNIDEEYKTTRKRQNKEIYNKRMVTKKQDLERQVLDQKYKQQIDLKKAIQLSKKQQKINKQDLINIEEQSDEERYIKVSFDDRMKKNLEHVNSRWLNAQRRIQQSRKIKVRHRISQKIKPKIFKNCQIVLGNQIYAQKQEIIRLVKETGGSICEQPKNGCYFICSTLSDKKIQACKNKEGVKFVVPDFIYHSITQGRKCQISDYKPK